MNKREEQSEYVPPDNALHLHGQRRRYTHQPVWGRRERWSINGVTNTDQLRYMIEDRAGASGLQKSDVLDENYEGDDA